jgi:hypothetical protein
MATATDNITDLPEQANTLLAEGYMTDKETAGFLKCPSAHPIPQAP